MCFYLLFLFLVGCLGWGRGDEDHKLTTMLHVKLVVVWCGCLNIDGTPTLHLCAALLLFIMICEGEGNVWICHLFICELRKG
jgi:hypothetical protein